MTGQSQIKFYEGTNMNQPRDAQCLDGVSAVVTACDEKGITTYMNQEAARAFAAEGGFGLLGTDMRQCHPGGSLAKFEGLLASRRLNAYTIEKAGKKKLIYQAPVFLEGEFKGYVEFGLPLPEGPLPHFARQE
jgi:sensor histidine kinase regulating citrate/malate metabolism